MNLGQSNPSNDVTPFTTLTLVPTPEPSTSPDATAAKDAPAPRTDAEMLVQCATFVPLPDGAKAAPAVGVHGKGVSVRLSPEDRQRLRGTGTQLALLCGGERVQLPGGKWGAIVVIDVDTKPAWIDHDGKERPAQDGHATFLAAEARLGDLPETLMCTTASGAVHLYYWAPTDLAFPNKVISSRMKLGGGVEIQNDGQYVVFPGGHVSEDYAAAQRADGKNCIAGRYEWEDPSAKLAELPAVWVEALRKHAVAAPEPGRCGDWTPVPLYARRTDPRLAWAQTYLTKTAPLTIEGQGGRNTIIGVGGTLLHKMRLPLDVARVLILKHYNPRLVSAGTTVWVPGHLPGELDERLASAAATSHIPIEDVRTEAELDAFDAGFLCRPPKATAGGATEGEPNDTDNADLDRGDLPPHVSQTGRAERRKRNPTHAYSHEFNESIKGAKEKLKAISDAELGELFSVNGPDPRWCGVFQWDRFNERLMAVDPPMPLDAETKGLTATDITAIRFYIITERQRLVKDERIRPVIMLAASHNAFHPVRDYLDALPKPSLAEAEASFAGIAGRTWGASAELDDLESGVFRRFAIGAVRRIRYPGTQVDESPIWYGEQGIGKSRLLRKLFGEFFADNMPGDLANRDAAHHLIGKWCVEDGELVGHARTSAAVKKAFMTRVEDKYRDFGSGAPICRPRSCVFAGTTDNEACLSDPSGNRRYNVLAVRKEIDVERFDRDSFWAAANVLEASGASHFSDRTETVALAASRVAYTEADAWTDEVLACAALAGERVTAKACLTAVVPTVADHTPERLRRVQGILRKTFGAAKVNNGVSAYNVPEEMRAKPRVPEMGARGCSHPGAARPVLSQSAADDEPGATVPPLFQTR